MGAVHIHGVIDSNTAYEKYQILVELVKQRVIEVEPETNYFSKAFEIALKHKVTIYDSLYMAQAINHRAKLLTSDKRQAEVAEKLGIEVVYIPSTSK